MNNFERQALAKIERLKRKFPNLKDIKIAFIKDGINRVMIRLMAKHKGKQIIATKLTYNPIEDLGQVFTSLKTQVVPVRY